MKLIPKTLINNVSSGTTVIDVPPTDAIGIVGIDYYSETSPTYHVRVSLNVYTASPPSGRARNICRFDAWQGQKSATGFFPLHSEDTVEAALGFQTAVAGSPAEAGVGSVIVIYAL